MRIKKLGVVDYQPTFEAMKSFTAERSPDTEDEIWLLQHPPVYTQGLSGRPEHIIRAPQYPVVQIDRGGQVTYHGPGQWVAYILFDLRRAEVQVRQLVTILETAVVELLAELGIEAVGNPEARGVYVDGKKIASLGLKVSRGCSYHGLALNSDMDLTPFQSIHPCGYEGLEVTSVAALLGTACPSMTAIGDALVQCLRRGLTRPA